ncbi:hypothetical protein, partial [Endozoicomonas sp. SESOKO1]|uniref:hypothetical protein n=1 Tax=Endozoicomonas sp. SESOKO1 TaxID=2828742 RepID=UPI002148D5F9
MVQQPRPGATPKHCRNIFNGKKVSNHHSHRGTATTPDNGKCFEDAFWEKKPLHGRQITSAGVLGAYRNDGSSLRSGFFLQKLCLQNILHGNKKVNPDQVIQEFSREPDRNKKYQLAIARFKEECCLRGLLLNGRQVTPEMVVKDFPGSPEGRLGKARFKESCCLRGLPLYRQRVTADAVVKDYQAVRATLELARFIEQCYLRGLLLNGQLVTPETVADNFQLAGATLELVRFKERCCLRGVPLSGQQVSPEVVAKGYQAARATRELARFKAECCLRGLSLNGQAITPNAVVKEYQAARATLEVARFKAECCLRGRPLNGKQVTPDTVVTDFPDSPEGRLTKARFKEECCLRGLLLKGQPVSPEAVARDFQDIPAPLELARFKAACCLRGLPLKSLQVTPDAVVRDFPNSPEGKLGIARFKAECCLRGLPLNSLPVTTDAVVKDYQASGATLELARFKEECCLRGLALKGRQVTPDEVIKDFPNSPEGKLGMARFQEQCCLMGLSLKGQQVTPETVVEDFPNSPEGKLGIARFKSECCLRGLALNGQLVAPDAIVKDYERGGWLLEKAIFYAQLALNAKALNGNHLDNRKVLQAFNEAPGDYSSRQVRFLMQRLKQPQQYDETDEAQDILQEAWQMLKSISVKDDEQHRLQCILKFMAMQHELPIDHQRVSAGQVWQSIKALRSSFQNLCIHFFFLANCYITNQLVYGQPIHKGKVLECLQNFPEGSRLRNALGYWLRQCSPEANVIDELLFKWERSVDRRRDNDHPHGYVNTAVQHNEIDNIPDDQADAVRAAQPLEQCPKTGGPGFPGKQVPPLNALTLKTLEIIQEINDSDSPPILITGSYARFLQNRCSSFNDIDVICTTEDSARALFEKLQAFNSDRYSEISKSIIIWSIPGCQEIKLPSTYNIHLKVADLGTKAMGFQVNVDARVADGNAAPLAVHVPGVGRPVWCLSFAEETRLLNDTLDHLADNLYPLTEQLQKGAIFDLPRTILFNKPKNTGERIYGLLMRSLLTLNKARQF